MREISLLETTARICLTTDSLLLFLQTIQHLAIQERALCVCDEATPDATFSVPAIALTNAPSCLFVHFLVLRSSDFVKIFSTAANTYLFCSIGTVLYGHPGRFSAVLRHIQLKDKADSVNRAHSSSRWKNHFVQSQCYRQLINSLLDTEPLFLL